MAIFDAHKNLAISTITTPPTPPTSGNALAVTPGTAGRFPAVPFNATIWPANQPALPTNAEVVRVVNIAGDSFQITRAQEQSLAREIVAGDLIAATITAKTMTDIEAAVNAMGTWQNVPFNAAHFTGTAPMTWTVGAGAIVRNRYAIVGKTLFWSVYISWFSGSNVLGGSPSASINITMPAGIVAQAQIVAIDFSAGITGSAQIAGTYGSVNGAAFQIQKSLGGNFALSDTPGLVFNVMIEIA